MQKYIWQLDAWIGHAPAFRWQATSLTPKIKQLENALKSFLPDGAALIPDAQTQVNIDSLVQSILRSSEIEGEVLNAGSVRSSVVNKLRLDSAGLSDTPTQQTNALADVLIAATTHLEQPVTLEHVVSMAGRAMCRARPNAVN